MSFNNNNKNLFLFRGTTAFGPLHAPCLLDAQRHAVASYMTLLLGASPASRAYWAPGGALRQLLARKFVDSLGAGSGGPGGTADERLAATAGEARCDLSCDALSPPLLLQRVCDMCDVQVAPGSAAPFSSSDVRLGSCRVEPMAFVRLLEGESTLEEARCILAAG